MQINKCDWNPRYPKLQFYGRLAIKDWWKTTNELRVRTTTCYKAISLHISKGEEEVTMYSNQERNVGFTLRTDDVTVSIVGAFISRGMWRNVYIIDCISFYFLRVKYVSGSCHCTFQTHFKKKEAEWRISLNFKEL